MRKWVVLFVICCFTNSFSQTNVSPQFSELKGMEDQQGNTHLFYRIFSETYGVNSNSRNNDIYRLSINSMVDTIFLHDWLYSSPVMESAKFVYDYNFWNENYSEYIFCGLIGLTPEPIAYVERFDGNTNYYQWGEINEVEISKQNDSLIYASGDIFSNLEKSIKSIDGGWNWTSFNDSLKFISLNPLNENILFFENILGFLYRSTDAGNTFNLVDLLNQPANSTSFLYDPDQLHIYRLFGNQTLRVSPNNGEPFSWQTKYSSDTEIFISIDESISGTIYLADKKNIFVSTDYGYNFTLYKSLDRKIVGIYKKPNSNKLYAASKYKIYEITSDTTQVIKCLPIPDEILNLYPLAIGNKWIYLTITSINPNIEYGIQVEEVIGDTVAANGKLYYHLMEDEYHFLNRIDSVDGKVYRFLENPNLPESEYVIADLSGEVGDTTITFSPIFPGSPSYLTITDIDTFNKWGLVKLRKNFSQTTYLAYSHFSYTEDIGLDYWGGGTSGFSSYFERKLKGCVLNGIVYGDTALTDIGDQEIEVVNEFKLEQNYPNPFNPSTKIKFSIPNFIASGAKQSQFVTLIIYDILGNEVATLVNEEKPGGKYEVEFEGIRLPSGIYFYQLRVGGPETNSGQALMQTKKMVLLK